MDGIAKTSLLTAALRAVESKRSDAEGRLFTDPYAEILAGDEGKVILQKAIEAAGDQPAIAIRTAFIDQKINEALNRGVRQIVMLAAGMDTRAFRMSFPTGTKLFELDQKEVFAYKEEKLKGIETRCERKTLALDLRDEWQPALLQAGFQKGAPTLWMVEGLLMYLEEPQVLKLFERIKSLSSSGDVLLCDILSRSLLETPHMKGQLQFLQSMGATWHFGANDPQAFLAQFGWSATLTQAGEFAPTRWPFPTVPLSVPNVPRGFYVEAVKK